MQASIFLQKLKSLNKENLLEVKGIGEILADNFVEHINSDRVTKLIDQFIDLEKNQKGVEVQITNQKSKKKVVENSKGNVCITGTFDKTREEIKKILEENGYLITDNIKKDTNILLAGEKAGSKLQKATEKNIQILHNYQELI